MRKVLPLVGLSLVVSPTIAPSLADQSLGLPSQSVRSLPLKIGLKPSSAAWAAAMINAMYIITNTFRIEIRSPRKLSKGNTPQFTPLILFRAAASADVGMILGRHELSQFRFLIGEFRLSSQIGPF